MFQRASRTGLASVTPLEWVAAALAIVSALVHLILGVRLGLQPFGILFILAAIGFGVGIGLAIVSSRRRLITALGIPYTGVQIVLWYVLNQPGSIGGLSTPELIDKTAQILLIVLLSFLLYRRKKTPTSDKM